MRSRVQPAPPAPSQKRFIPSLPTLDPALLAPTLEPPRPPLFPLDRLTAPSTQLFYLARAGVYHTIKHWLGGAPGVVVMPAYHHGVEVEAVRAAGARVVFYRVDRDMRIDLDDLRKKANGPDVRAVYVTHFVGFAQPIAEARTIARERGVPLFEDCALALFSRTPDGAPLGSVLYRQKQAASPKLPSGRPSGVREKSASAQSSNSGRPRVWAMARASAMGCAKPTKWVT